MSDCNTAVLYSELQHSCCLSCHTVPLAQSRTAQLLVLAIMIVSKTTLCRGRRDAKRMMGPQWRKVYEQNYHRSLDHRSFYFKQVDKRHLGAKGMLQVCTGANVCLQVSYCLL